MDIRENLSVNLARFRKSANLTQAELAEKLNYSDKAISKWERGESFPDIYVLKQLADFYEVTVDTLISEPKKERVMFKKIRAKKRTILCICASILVWLIAICAFSFLNIIIPTITETWLAFIYAIPVTLIVLLIFTSIWKKKITTGIILSLLVWTLVLSVYLTLISITEPIKNLWMLFLIGIPLQTLIIFWSIYRKIN